MGVLLEYFDEFDVEYESSERRNVGTRPVFAIGEVVGDEKPVFGPFGHQLHTFGPSRDDLAETKVGWRIAAVGRVEHGAVDETTFVVAPHGVGGFGFASVAWRDHFVLQAARGDGDTLAFRVFGKELFTFRLGFFARFGRLLLLLLFQVGEELPKQLLGFLGRHLYFPIVEDVVDSGGEIVCVELSAESHVFQLVAYVEAERIAEFVHLCVFVC